MAITRHGKLGVLAVVAVALVAAGAAFAATKFHGSSVVNGPGAFDGPAMQGGPAFVPDGDRDRGFGFHRPGGDISVAATYLGLSEDALLQELQSGKTLAQIANGVSGKSAAGLIDALVTAQKAQIAAAVKAGTLTQAMADRITADLQARITARVNGTFGLDRGGFGPPAGQAPTHI